MLSALRRPYAFQAQPATQPVHLPGYARSPLILTRSLLRSLRRADRRVPDGAEGAVLETDKYYPAQSLAATPGP